MNARNNFSTCKLAMVALLLDEEKENLRKGKRRTWVHDILKTRQREGEYHTLYKQLLDDDSRFYQYFRMPPYQFVYLLKKNSNSIRKQNTFKRSISPREKLAVCLR